VAPSPIVWDEQGTPRSTLFDDVYRSRGFHGMDRGLLQARHVFLQGCGLWSPAAEPAAWQQQAQWHVLETGFGLGLNFLATWHAWQQDPQRPQRLFFSAIEAWPVSAADIERSAQAWPEMQPLASKLAQAWRGLMPGLHRLVFEGGHVQLSLYIGPVDKMLREIDVAADSIYLDGFSPDVNPQMWDLHTLKAVARLCRPGARVASWCVKRSVREDLAQCGFAVERADGLPPKSHRLQAVFAPHWTPRTQLRQPTRKAHHARDALVLGAGLSGSAVACSLARRGWQVRVLDAGQGVGAGASGLPAGLTVPHVSPDDSLLSRITRAGVRATVQRCAQLLQSGQDWQLSGALEHRVEGKRAMPKDAAWPPAAHEWSTPASPEQTMAAGLPEQAQTLWHRMAAWLQPRRLVQAQLTTPGVQVRWQAQVAQLRVQNGRWQALNAQGNLLGEAPVLVIAGGYDTLELLKPFTQAIAFNPLRGQISMGRMNTLPEGLRAKLPPLPVNGHGSFITGVPLPAELGGQPAWYLGSTFERACTEPVLRSEDHAANHQRLATLLPDLSEPMRPGFAPGHVLGWAGLRCTLPDRVPAVGAVDHEKYPGLMVCAGMGARGISLSVLCGELMAAELEGEPLPLEPALAQRLKAERFNATKSKNARTTPAASAAQSAHSP
jgi:tRNA 5-methylaminomethyl-2-thiouridine biosynthesis bifunctional protein